jgi:hypothetical protein
MVGMRGVFSGIVDQVAKAKGSKNKTTICLVNVKDANEQEITDHVWIKPGRNVIHNINPKKDDFFVFEAIVIEYPRLGYFSFGEINYEFGDVKVVEYIQSAERRNRKQQIEIQRQREEEKRKIKQAKLDAVKPVVPKIEAVPKPIIPITQNEWEESHKEHIFDIIARESARLPVTWEEHEIARRWRDNQRTQARKKRKKERERSNIGFEVGSKV